VIQHGTVPERVAWLRQLTQLRPEDFDRFAPRPAFICDGVTHTAGRRHACAQRPRGAFGALGTRLSTGPMSTYEHIREHRGGDTMWASMYAAHEALSDAMQRLLSDLHAVHGGGAFQAIATRRMERVTICGDEPY
jgi:Taurine catabolism dioxygenase TauD, TfdA family